MEWAELLVEAETLLSSNDTKAEGLARLLEAKQLLPASVREKLDRMESPTRLFCSSTGQLCTRAELDTPVGPKCKCLRCSSCVLDPEALGIIGSLAYIGFGCEPSSQRAAAYFRAAGDADNTFLLGSLFMHEDDFSDEKRAADTFRLAADMGSAKAATQLGWMLAHGVGCAARSVDQAAELYLSASEQGDPVAMYNLAVVMLATDSEHKFARSDPAVEVPEADQRRGWYWMWRSAEAKLPTAQYHMARYLLLEAGHLHAARKMLLQAAEGGYVPAQYNVAVLYLEDQHPSLAFNWFLSAAQKGHVQAQYIVGWMYVTGSGIQHNPAKASVFLRQAMANGHQGAAPLLHLLPPESIHS